MSSSDSTSSAPDIEVVYASGESSSDDDSAVLRHIRQIPLPSPPAAIAQQDADTGPASLPHADARTSLTRRPTLPGFAVPQPVPAAGATAAPASFLMAPLIPLPAASAPASSNSAMSDPPVVPHIPAPPSLVVSSSASSPTVPALPTTATLPNLIAENKTAEHAAQPSFSAVSIPHLVVPPLPQPVVSSPPPVPSSSSSLLAASVKVSSEHRQLSSSPPVPSLGSGSVSPQITNVAAATTTAAAPPRPEADTAAPLPAPLSLSVPAVDTVPTADASRPAPTPALPAPAPTLASSATASTAAATAADLSYAVTSLLPTADAQAKEALNQKSAANVSISASLSNRSKVPLPLHPTSPSTSARQSSEADTRKKDAAGSVHQTRREDAATAEAKTAGRPRHIRRSRNALEAADRAIFTSPDGDKDSSSTELTSSSGSSSSAESDEEGYAFVGRTRRTGHGIMNAEASKQLQPDASLTGQEQKEKRRRSSRKRKERKEKRMIITMREIEGKSGSLTSREKASQSSHSTNALTPDEVAKKRHGRPPTPLLIKKTDDRDNAGEAPTLAEEDQEDDVPLTFTSPAARFAALCSASTKNKGLSRRNARRLTRNSLLGYDGDVSAAGRGLNSGAGRRNSEDVDSVSDDDTDDASEHARAGTVHFRFTGAFSDATSDSKVLPATLHELQHDNERRAGAKAKKGSAETGHGGDAGAATVLSLNIRGMSPLHADVGVVHPFVRAWIVSCVSGQSLVQASAAVPCAVTQPFDIRAHRTRSPWWDAKVALRLSAERLRGAASDAMLLLEVLDFGNETIHGFPLLRAGLYPICWGYLMLRDCTGRSALAVAENVHVQMYRYPQRTPWYLTWLEALLPSSWSAAGAALQTYDVGAVVGDRPRLSLGLDALTDVPSIYHIFKFHFNRKIPYLGGMVISLRQHRDAGFVPDTTDMLAYEEYLLSMLVSGGGSCAVPRSTQAAAAAAAAMDSEADESNDDAQERNRNGRRPFKGRLGSSAVAASPWAQATENYYRMDGERSLLPHEVLQTSAVMGVVTCVSFAHNGTLFALGVYRHLQYLIELRNPLLPDMPVLATLLGHTGHLHRLVFQKEDRYMLSCSSDGTVRVWQPTHPNSPFSADACAGPSCVQCVCTLPHGFPVYSAIFHQEKIITGGFSDQLFVWAYEKPLEGELPSMTTTAEDSTLHLTATFTPQLQISQNDDGGSGGGGLTGGRAGGAAAGAAAAAARVLLGELIYRVDNAGVVGEGGEPTITLSLASNERSNRAWSVHANGAVVCWRAVAESADRGGGNRGSKRHANYTTKEEAVNWQMSVRHTADCDGATEVQVNGSYAIVVCGQAPLVFVFDATTCEQLRVVSTRLPPATPVCLLPDGEAFVGAVGDPSRLLAWECFDGGLCTAPTGYARAAPLYAVARMSWAESQQLAVLVSRAPCSEEDVVRFLRGPTSPAPGQSAAAYYYAKQEEQYRLQSMPSEMTLLTVAGTVRSRGTVIQTVDGRASEAFCAMFGGDMKAKRKAEYLAQRTQASRQRETERDSRRARLHQETMMVDPSSAFATAVNNIPYDATEKGARMNAIINFWRGLVGQHKHGADEGGKTDADVAASAQTATPPHPATHRALQYLDDEDGNDADV